MQTNKKGEEEKRDYAVVTDCVLSWTAKCGPCRQLGLSPAPSRTLVALWRPRLPPHPPAIRQAAAFMQLRPHIHVHACDYHTFISESCEMCTRPCCLNPG